MITDALVQALLGIVTYLLGLLPYWEAPVADWAQMGAYVGNSARLFGGYFPLGTLAACLGVLVAARFALFAWTVVVWVWGQIPVIGGSGN